ncbi:hypothetical protein KA005_74690, partial [bacterium]|nr:hypothetical protein [bacterium]
TKRTRNFNEAINLLNNYVEENPDSPDLVFIENIKTSYTRILLEQLNDIRQIELGDWIRYWSSFLKVESEATKMLSENPILKEGYKKFISICKEEFVEFVTNLPNSERKI